jgi:DNA-binding SARP family transcriptional activator
VDADEFDAAASALAENREARPRPLERAASLCGGEPLPEERCSDWALAWRDWLTDLYAGVLAALCDDRLDRGDLIVAALRARDLVQRLGVEPAIETAAVQRRVLAGEPV